MTAQITPMFRQYRQIKDQHQDAFLFFRMGDFYEMFFEDAKRGAEILDITLTARHNGKSNSVPMCGVPFHSAQGYINRLTQAGHKVALCEQTEDPSQTKGLVKREVIRVITPGTNLEEDASSESKENNFICAIVKSDTCKWGIAYLDLSTGDFNLIEFDEDEDMINYLSLIRPKEIIAAEFILKSPLLEQYLLKNTQTFLKQYEDWIFDFDYCEDLIKKTFTLSSLQGLGFQTQQCSLSAAGSVIHYLRDQLYKNLAHIHLPKLIEKHQFVTLDRHTVEHLELFHDSTLQGKGHSLFNTLNKTKTAMGKRLLANWLKHPLIDLEEILNRQNFVSAFLDFPSSISSLRKSLGSVRDIEKIIGRLTCGLSNPRDLISLKESLDQVPVLKNTLNETESNDLKRLGKELICPDELSILIESSIVEQPPALTRNGGFIKRGYSKELDAILSISSGGREWMASFQQTQIEKTGIKTLKVKFNKVFGYYIEISKANASLVPDNYERKQTLVNAERFMVPELKEYEEQILGADEKSKALEIKIFEQIKSRILEQSSKLQALSISIAKLDNLLSFAQLASEWDYTRPEITTDYDCAIVGGRHPVVEQVLSENGFVENDVHFVSDSDELLLITGPNMSGKSTYLRQAALIVILAQMGSFVPATSAKIGLVDQIFTRIGATDHLTLGESTFMVEMIETANILNNATERSLIIMDEVGRGTSTFDGVSIAWAICEFLMNMKKTPKTLFATHYHELAELDNIYPSFKNLNASVKDDSSGITFLRKIVAGAADKSYGIHVAELAGLPKLVIQRAKEVLRQIETDHDYKEKLVNLEHKNDTQVSEEEQLPLWQAESIPNPVLEKLRSIQVNELTPIEALNLISELQTECQSVNVSKETP